MTTVDEVLKQLAACGSPTTVATYRRHGAKGDLFGCKVADMKTIAKQLKGQQQLALDLYASGNLDAMYLAGMIADGSKMTTKQLQSWATQAKWHMVGEYTVPGVTCEHPDAWQLGLKWIAAKQPHIAAAGWATLAGMLSITPDEELDLPAIKKLLAQIEKEITNAPNRVRYVMNGFVISVGTYVMPLLAAAKATAKKIGVVQVDMGDTACKVPLAIDYITKVESMKRVGKKRKTVKC